MKAKRGDISLSFGMIISIIIIAAILATAFYTISYFLKLKQCTDVGLFGRDLQNKVDDAWNSDSVHDTFTGIIPGSIKEVCLGNLTQASSREEYTLLKRYLGRDANLFYYPPGKCDISYIALKHARFSGFSCAKVKNGKASVTLEKSETDALVLVRPVA